MIPVGTRIGDFVVDTLIGSGGMGQVYRAHQAGVDRPVALKVLAPQFATDPDFVRRFRREAATMRDLEHPAIIAVYAAGSDAGQVYIATRLVTGSSLAAVLTEHRLMPPDVIDVLRPLADGLDHAHGRGVVHRDIKPANILIDADGRPFLADFGISKEVGAAATQTGQYLGTPRYMAPEQAVSAGGVGHRADLYSFACVAFEMLTGSAPFTEADTIPLLLAHARAPVPRASTVNPALPPAVDRVLVRALAKRPGDRYPSAHAFIDDLAAALTAPVRHRHSRRRLVAGAIVASLALIAALVVVVPAMFPDPAPGTTQPAAPVTEAPVPTPANLANVARGELFYEAPLDGTSTGFVISPGTEPDSARADVRFVPGALELEIWAEGGDTYSELDVRSGIETFLGLIDVSVRPGSEVELCWSLRWAVPQQLAAFLCVQTATGEAGFQVFRRGQGKEPLGEQVVLDVSGQQVVRLAVLVQDRQLSLYRDGVLILDVVNDQVPTAGTLPGIEVEGPDGTGLVRIEQLRIYELPATA